MKRETKKERMGEGKKERATECYLNLSTARRPASPKHIMMDSIRMKRDCVRIAVSRERVHF